MDHEISFDSQTLLSQLERLAMSHGKNDKTMLLPSPRQLLSMGGILFRVSTQSSDLVFAFQHLVDSVPASHWKVVMGTLEKAARRLASTASQDDIHAAVQSLNGLLCNAPKICHIAYSKEWVATLAAIYDQMMLKDASQSRKHVLLSTVSSLLLDGLLLRFQDSHGAVSGTSVEESLLEAIHAMEEESTDCLGDLQLWQSQKEPFRRTLQSEVQKMSTANALPSKADTDVQQQRDYILSMLESSTRPKEIITSVVPSSTSKRSETAAAASKLAPKPVSAADEMERRIQQVKQILPDFGEGFIEAALSLHQGNVEATVSVLLGEPSTYPTSLRVSDPSLPRRRKERSQEEAYEAAQARQLVKERVALEHQQEEARYKALLYVQQKEEQEQAGAAAAGNGPPIHDEYDDDYDDQYDEIDIKLGGADDGMYDFEQVKLYNQLVRTDEAEDSFWQENRNTNRMPPKNSSGSSSNNKNPNNGDDADDAPRNGKQYRGPDKIKGGRIIGPDGKIVRNIGGGRGKKKGGGGGGGGLGNGGATGAAKVAPNGNGNKSKNGGGATAAGSQTGAQVQANNNDNDNNSKGSKPRTKPKSQNRLNRQRDKKQKAQGTFGAPN